MKVEGTFILKWKREGVYYQRQLEKRPVYSLFEQIMKRFTDDNEVSTKLVEIIPDISHLIIDWDSNTTRDARSIDYVIEGKKDILQIKYHHKIVWENLEKYCQGNIQISPEEFMDF